MANSEGSKRSNRGAPLAATDRISALPEALLCHILSSLPTNYAVQTSILSKRWKHLWTRITSLDFDEELFTYPAHLYEENDRFVQFVYRVLVLLKTPCIQKFCIRCESDHDPFHVNTWASAALSRDVRELTLSVSIHVFFEIPISLFTCKSLSSLSLNCGTTLDVPNSVFLPNLKYMHLSGLLYANAESLPKLLSGCPVLEDLSVERNYVDDICHFSISSPTLKSLRLNYVNDDEPNSPRHTLQIDAPLLQYLYVSNAVSNEFVIGNLSSLIEADICVYVSENDETGYGSEVLKLINGLSNVKFLKLSGFTMKALSYAREHAAPAFCNLTRLEGDFGRHLDEPWCMKPEHVPKYLLSRLTTAVIADFDGTTDALMMVKYILNGAKSLERMTIFTQGLVSKLELLEEITKFPRVSKHCQLVVN